MRLDCNNLHILYPLIIISLLGLRLMCSKFNLLFFPALPKKFTHYSYFMLLSLPIVFIKFFLAILHASSSGVVNVAGAAVKRVL